MELYRIAKCPYIKDISGTGAHIYGGRWNSKGMAMLYTAGNRSLAALEALVHIPQKNMTAGFCLLVLNMPDDINVKTIKQSGLPVGWKSIPIQPALQEIGNKWLEEGRTAILRVPSVIIPEEYNYLINPLHPDAKRIKVQKVNAFVFDERISKVENLSI